jgi:hypothetical protein
VGKKPKEMRWLTICLTCEHTEKSTKTYPYWEACASLFVVVDIFTNHDGLRLSGFEEHCSSTAMGLVVLIAYGLQQFFKVPPPGHMVDLDALAILAKSFSFSEVRKRTLQSRLCSVLCDTTSDQGTLLNCWDIIMPWGPMTLYVTFDPTADDTLRISIPKVVRNALHNHKAHFY